MLDYYQFKEIHKLYCSGLIEEARCKLAEMQNRYIAACDENIMLRKQLQDLEDTLFFAKNLFFDGLFYWLMTGTLKQGPFCQACYDREGALLRVETSEEKKWFCSACGKHYAQQSLSTAVKQEKQQKQAIIIPFSKAKDN